LSRDPGHHNGDVTTKASNSRLTVDPVQEEHGSGSHLDRSWRLMWKIQNIEGAKESFKPYIEGALPKPNGSKIFSYVSYPAIASRS